MAMQKSREDVDNDKSDSESSAMSDSMTWDEMVLDINTDVQCLADLDPIIKSTFNSIQITDRVISTTQSEGLWKSSPIYEDHIRGMLPNMKPELIHRFARANQRRVQRLQETREANLKEMNDKGKGVNPPPSEHSMEKISTPLIPEELALAKETFAETLAPYLPSEDHPNRAPPVPARGAVQCMVCERQITIPSNLYWR